MTDVEPSTEKARLRFPVPEFGGRFLLFFSSIYPVEPSLEDTNRKCWARFKV
jgi:hypothetical protein